MLNAPVTPTSNPRPRMRGDKPPTGSPWTEIPAYRHPQPQPKCRRARKKHKRPLRQRRTLLSREADRGNSGLGEDSSGTRQSPEFGVHWRAFLRQVASRSFAEAHREAVPL